MKSQQNSYKKKTKNQTYNREANNDGVYVNVGVIETEYVSGALNNSDLDEFDSEKGHKYENFRIEQLNEDYEFNIGMEFNSLVEFKDSIIEWSVLNESEVRFVKNDSDKVRVECKAKCGFVGLCEKFGGKHTYIIKRWDEDHTCARVLYNNSTTSK